MNLQRYENKVALITGCGGMGRAVALRLLEEAGRVILVDYSQESLSKQKEEFENLGYGEKVLLLQADVRDLQDCCAVVQEGIAHFGKIDVLIPTAGILRHHPIDELTEEDWKDVIDINLTGTYHSVRAVVNHMKDRRYGRIVLISSVGGRTGRPGVGVNYAAAKGGVVGMTQLLGYELGPWNITVNCVAPGPIGGRMFESLPEEKQARLLEGIRLGRIGNFDDVAAAVAYLGSDDASWTTGEVLDVNGGLQY
ncbi:SDR family oxidoreductase [Hominifimenecus sp. rT4P-3]|uniref:SDR family oxidoreductase n=1 Tax=Hominifimenecus sp. rT4P-3 TaxID=3242979 RepID=UPI003DA39651